MIPADTTHYVRLDAVRAINQRADSIQFAREDRLMDRMLVLGQMEGANYMSGVLTGCALLVLLVRRTNYCREARAVTWAFIVAAWVCALASGVFHLYYHHLP